MQLRCMTQRAVRCAGVQAAVAVCIQVWRAHHVRSGITAWAFPFIYPYILYYSVPTISSLSLSSSYLVRTSMHSSV